MTLPRAIGLQFVCALASCTATTKTEGAKKASDPSVSSSGQKAPEVGSLVIDGVPEIPAELTERLRRYQNVRSAMLFGWLDDGLLIGYVETPSIEDAVAGMEATEVNARWQAEMAEFFVDLGDARPDTGFLRLTEVFHLEDQLNAPPTPAK